MYNTHRHTFTYTCMQMYTSYIKVLREGAHVASVGKSLLSKFTEKSDSNHSTQSYHSNLWLLHSGPSKSRDIISRPLHSGSAH